MVRISSGSEVESGRARLEFVMEHEKVRRRPWSV
jgi:hypothetical protein